jgi:hypothetical protein
LVALKELVADFSLPQFLVVMVVPITLTSIGRRAYLSFAAMNACFIPVIYFLYPETKKRFPEEIDLIFA